MERSLEASTAVSVAFGRARKVLLADPGVVFGDSDTVDDRRARRFRSDLAVGLGGGACVHQQVTLQLGAPRSVGTELLLPLSWHPRGRQRWLPSFRGVLCASPDRRGTRLRMQGTYSVPLGVFGRLGNDVVGHRFARRSLGDLVDEFGRRLGAEVRRTVGSTEWARDLETIDLREGRSEIYVG
jgi:hypothetical protein